MFFSPLKKLVLGGCLRGFFVSPFLNYYIVYFTLFLRNSKGGIPLFYGKNKKKPENNVFYTGFSGKEGGVPRTTGADREKWGRRWLHFHDRQCRIMIDL